VKGFYNIRLSFSPLIFSEEKQLFTCNFLCGCNYKYFVLFFKKIVIVFYLFGALINLITVHKSHFNSKLLHIFFPRYFLLNYNCCF